MSKKMIRRGSSLFILVSAAVGCSAFAPASLSAPVAGRRNGSSVVSNTATADSSVAETTSSPSSSPVLVGFDHHASSRLPYSPTGYSTWEWKTVHNPKNEVGDADRETTSHSINYIEMGDPSKPALVLIHGFGASSYHFRHNIPTLARSYHVYALDLLGFGWSDKPIMDYNASVWRDQVVDFVREIVSKNDDNNEQQRDIAIAGNSLGGYTAMWASSDERIRDMIRGCVLLNAAGRFRDPEATEEKVNDPNPIVEAISAAIQRFVIACSFVYTKQPLRIEQILKQVYPINDINVDSELVDSIRTPALNENAAEVFYRVITKNGDGPQQAYVDDILKELECPVLLAWGESDPWIRSAAADRMERLHADFHGESNNGRGAENGGSRWIRRASIDAGHCPHDEAPEAVNDAILGFADEVFGSKPGLAV